MFRQILLALLFAMPLGAAEVLPSPGKAVGVVTDDTPGGWAVIAQTSEGDVSATPINGDETKGYLGCYFEGLPGRYTVIKVNGFKIKTFSVTLGGVRPIPGPGPDPVPPDPGPTPPDPTPAVGPLKVVILEETADRSKYPKDVTGSYLSAAVNNYLRSHASKTGEFTDFGIWDDDYADSTLKSGGFPQMVDLYNRAKTDAAGRLPWLIIEQKTAAGVPVVVHSSPATSDTLGTLKKYGGQ